MRTRARLIESRVDIDELSDEELEVIIKDEEDKLLDEYKTKGLFLKRNLRHMHFMRIWHVSAL